MKQVKFNSNEYIIRECITTTEIGFKGLSFKLPHKQRREELAMYQWDALILLHEQQVWKGVQRSCWKGVQRLCFDFIIDGSSTNINDELTLMFVPWI